MSVNPYPKHTLAHDVWAADDALRGLGRGLVRVVRRMVGQGESTMVMLLSMLRALLKLSGHMVWLGLGAWMLIGTGVVLMMIAIRLALSG